MSEYDIQDFEDQEWTLGGDEKQAKIEYKGMEFLVQDPGTDAIMELLAPNPDGESDQTPSERLFQLLQSSVVAPEITLERWRDMRSVEQIGLMTKVVEAVGLEEIMGFQDGSLEVGEVE